MAPRVMIDRLSGQVSCNPVEAAVQVSDATTCLKEQLQSLSKKPKNKAFGKGSQGRQNLAVEISWADTSPTAVVKLVEDLLRSLGKDISSSILVAFYDVEAALIGSDRLSNEVQAVDDSSDSKTRQYSQVLLLVGVPTGQEDSAIESLNWRGSVAVLLSLDTNSLDPKFPATRRSFKTIYAFEAFAMKGWLKTTEGVAIKQVRSGAPAAWQVYKRSGSNWKLIGRTPERPTAVTVELALYNSSAAENPINKGIGAFRSAFSKK